MASEETKDSFHTVLVSTGTKPLEAWDKKVRNGHIRRLNDNDMGTDVLELCGTNVTSNFISCPRSAGDVLDVELPIVVLVVKNVDEPFQFEVQILDNKNVRRRFRASSTQGTTRIKPFICSMPLRLDPGWNKVAFNLGEYTRRAYGTTFVKVIRVQIHANCRIRRVYLCDKDYAESELPSKYKAST